MSKPEPLIDGKEIARFLHVSYPSVLRWISEGHGPPHYLLNEPKLSSGNTKKKNGRPRQPRHLIRFRMSEVEEWVKTRRRGMNGSS